jgi:F-type H+-transporting ATPase subunit b
VDELGLNLPSLLIFGLNFLLLLAILYIFAYKPVLRLLDQRADRIRESLEAADKARQEAAVSEARTQEQLAEARREGQRLLDQARAQAEKYREDEMAKAHTEANTFVERARQDIQRERDDAIEEVKANFARLTIQAAERVISKSLDEGAHRDLIVKVLEEGHQIRKG